MKTMEVFSPFGSDTWWLLSVITCGLKGRAAVKLTASKHGFSLYFRNTVVARGKTPAALKANYECFEQRMKAHAARRAAREGSTP